MTSAISIGKQDFASLRENHYFYVDKTDFIRQWWESGADAAETVDDRRGSSGLGVFYDRDEPVLHGTEYSD